MFEEIMEARAVSTKEDRQYRINLDQENLQNTYFWLETSDKKSKTAKFFDKITLE